MKKNKIKKIAYCGLTSMAMLTMLSASIDVNANENNYANNNVIALSNTIGDTQVSRAISGSTMYTIAKDFSGFDMTDDGKIAIDMSNPPTIEEIKAIFSVKGSDGSTLGGGIGNSYATNYDPANLDINGEYYFTFSYKNMLEGVDESSTIYLKIVDTDAPTFEFENGSIHYLYTDVEDPLTIDEIKSMFSAWDIYDGDLTDDIVYSTTYNPASVEVNGEYTINLSVSDSSGNEATTYLKLYTKDINDPVVNTSAIPNIFGGSMVTFDLSDYGGTINQEESTQINSYIETTLNENLSSFVSDYDTELTLNLDELNFICDTTNLLPNVPMTMGGSVTDSSENTTSFNFQVKLNDDVDPEIAIATTNITLSYQDVLDTDIIKDLVTCSDNVDSQLDISYDFGNFVANQVGTYVVDVIATDDFGNSSSIEININIVDNDKPSFITNCAYIQVNTLTSKETIDRLIRDLYSNMGAQAMQGYNLTSIESSYFNRSFGQAGEFNVISLFEEEETGYTYFDNVSLSVKDVTGTDDNDKDNDKDDINFFEEQFTKAKDYVKANPYKTALFTIITLALVVYIAKKTSKRY